jgi:hypothetical protein
VTPWYDERFENWQPEEHHGPIWRELLWAGGVIALCCLVIRMLWR